MHRHAPAVLKRLSGRETTIARAQQVLAVRDNVRGSADRIARDKAAAVSSGDRVHRRDGRMTVDDDRPGVPVQLFIIVGYNTAAAVVAVTVVVHLSREVTAVTVVSTSLARETAP